VIQQVGTPMELYDRPINRFIANFVGTVNLIRGTAEVTANGVVFSSPLIGRLTLPLAAPVSGAAEIAFRPHTLSLAAPDSTAAPGKGWIRGDVTEREVLGEFIRYRIAVDGTVVIADQPHFGGNIEFVPGNPVSIGIEPAQVKLLPA